MNSKKPQTDSVGEEEKAVAKPVDSLRTAFAFLTQLPMGKSVRFDNESIRQSILFYPVVGLALGLILYLLSTVLPFSLFLNASLIVLLLVILTGGLHLDGLADCTDAWFGGMGDKERTLEIMKDSHNGAMAAVALAMLLVVKTAAVYEVLINQQLSLLLLATLLSRTSILGLFMSTPYIGEGPIGKAIASADSTQLYGVLVTTAVLSFLLAPQTGLVALLFIVLITTVLLRRMMMSRLKGFTGDCAGALIELTEVVILIGGCLVL